MKDIKVFFDDLRKEPKGWTLCSRITSGLEFISRNAGRIKIISLDHDIKHWGEPVEGSLILKARGECSENYMSIAWAITLLSPDLYPEEVWVHSSNIEAYDKVCSILKPTGVKVVDVHYYDDGNPELRQKKK